MLRKIASLLPALFLCLSLPVQAGGSPLRADVKTIPVLSRAELCFDRAGRMYQIDPLLLEAIAKQESRFNPYATNSFSAGGTTDYGIMQVNSMHIPKLKRMGIIRQTDDLFNPCLNIQIGAWILAQHFRTCGVNWNCLGSYNAGFDKTRNNSRENYADIIYNNYRTLSRERRNIALH